MEGNDARWRQKVATLHCNVATFHPLPSDRRLDRRLFLLFQNRLRRRQPGDDDAVRTA